MRGRGRWPMIVGCGGALGFVAGCMPPGTFLCADPGSCSSRPGGVCEPDGYCSYPDASCDSERRYSAFAGQRAGQCVEPVAGTTIATGEGPSGSSDMATTGSATTDGPIPGDCDGVSCSDAGTCVVVDGEATCACDPGWYRVGLSCVEDPCATARCFFVDADAGDDRGDGSRESPWKTISRLETALSQAEPGDHFLLRRFATWSDQLDINGVDGALDEPIVIGAYGSLSDPKPRLEPGAVRISGSSHVVIRNLRIVDDATVLEPPNRPCVMVHNSQHVTVLGNELIDCINRGIRMHEDASFTVVADNVLQDVNNDAIFIADAPWTMPPAVVLAHHWVVDNVVGSVAGTGIMIGLENATGDVKVMGNVVTDVEGVGIRLSIEGYGWAGGNIVVRAGDVAKGTGGGFYINEAQGVRASGNVVFDSIRGFEVGAAATVTNNTVLGTVETLSLASLRSNAGMQAWSDNLLIAAPGEVSVRDNDPDGAGPDVTFDRHWYAPDCTFQVGSDAPIDLAAWQAALMSDLTSECAEGSGVMAPVTGRDPLGWDDDFYDALTPDAGWERCGDEAGAFACDGSRLGTTVVPIEDYFEEDGFGWEGPLLVRQRYPRPAQ